MDHDHGDLVDAVEELQDRILLVTPQPRERRAEHDREEDDREHVEVDQRLEGVPRDDPAQDLDHPRCLLRHLDPALPLGQVRPPERFERFRAHPRIPDDQVGKHEPDRHRDGRSDQVVANGLPTDAPHLGDVAEACRTHDKAGHDKRNDDHGDQVDPRVAELADGDEKINQRIDVQQVGAQSDHDAEDQSDGDLRV